MIRIRLLLFALFSLLWLPSIRAAELGEPYFESVVETESIANGVVTSLAQDSRGLIWFGTTEGVVSFDGYQLRRYRHDESDPHSLADDYVRALLPRPDGSLWVATHTAGISIYDPQRDHFNHLQAGNAADDLPDNGVVTLAGDADGAVWIGFGAAGLARWQAGQKTRHYRHDPADAGTISHNTVRSLLVDHRGDLWAGTVRGLNRLRRGSDVFEPIGVDPGDGPGLAEQYIYHLYQAEAGPIWIGTQADGVTVLDPDSLQIQRLPVGPDALSHPWVDGFVEPAPGRIWIATFGAGIDVWETRAGLPLRKLKRIQRDPSMPGSLSLDRVVAPLLDRSGLIWIGTWGGGLQWHNPRNADTFTTVRHSPLRQDGLAHPSVLSLLEAPDGRLWIGSDGAGIDVLDRKLGVVQRFAPQPTQAGALTDGTIRSLARTADGSLWVGTQQAGLLRYHPEQQRFRRVPFGGQDSRVPHLFVDREGLLWIGAQRGLARLDPLDEQVRFLTLADGRDFTESIWTLCEDRAGNLWVGAPSGLLVRRSGENVLHPAPPGLPAGVMDIVIRGDELWTIGTSGLHRSAGWAEGWPRLEPWGRGLQQIDPSYGRQMLLDHHGRLWTPRFLIDVERNAVTPLGRAEGADIGNVDIGARLVTQDGALLFGGTKGVLLIDPERYRPWDFEPTVLLTGLEIDGRREDIARLGGQLTLAADMQRFSIEFAALDFSAPEQNRYAYQLIGQDRNWIETDATRRVATYNNLWPGKYQLAIRAAGRAGQWSRQPLLLPLQVLPAWWQTHWFAAAMVLLAALAIYAAIGWRTARIRRNAQQLREQVEQRTGELSEAKRHAEQTLEDLRGAQQQLVAAEKMASLGQLVAGVAHEINTPIGIALTAASHLQQESRSAADKLERGQLTRTDLRSWNATTDEATRLILGSLERASTLIASFKQVSVDQASEQRRAFQLHEFLNEVKVSLQPSFKRSTHALEIDCPAGIALDTYPGALFQILVNLVNNAVLHAFGAEQSGRMQVSAAQEGDYVRLSFSDNGRGMDSEIARRAFDPFFTTRRGEGGSGLGLHVVYNLVNQLLGGQIELLTRPGEGTEFRMRIPLRAPNTARGR